MLKCFIATLLIAPCLSAQSPQGTTCEQGVETLLSDTKAEVEGEPRWCTSTPGDALLQKSAVRTGAVTVTELEAAFASPAPTPEPLAAQTAEEAGDEEQGTSMDVSFIGRLAHSAATARAAAGDSTRSAAEAVLGLAAVRSKDGPNAFVVTFAALMLVLVLCLALFWAAQTRRVQQAVGGLPDLNIDSRSLAFSSSRMYNAATPVASRPSSSKQPLGRDAQEALAPYEKKERGLQRLVPSESHAPEEGVAPVPIDTEGRAADDILSSIFIVGDREGQSLQLRGEFSPWDQDGEGMVQKLDLQHTPIASLKMCERGGSGKGILISPMHRLANNPPVGFIDTTHAVTARGMPAPRPRYVILQAVSDGWKHRPVAIIHRDERVEGRYLVRKYANEKQESRYESWPVLLIILDFADGKDLRIQDAHLRLLATVERSRVEPSARTLHIAHGVDASLIFSAVVAVAKLSSS